MFTLGSKLNRMYSIQLPFMKSTCQIDVAFNKSNSFIGFNLDQDHYIKSRRGELRSAIYQDLNKSEFATSFLDIRNFKSKNLDIQQQFNNILPDYKDSIQYETNETIKLTKVQTKKGSFDGCLYIYIFRYIDFGDEFIYCLAERQHIDVVLDKKIVRTSAIQICSNEVFEDMANIVESTNRDFVADAADVSTMMHNVFSNKKNINEKY